MCSTYKGVNFASHSHIRCLILEYFLLSVLPQLGKNINTNTKIVRKKKEKRRNNIYKTLPFCKALIPELKVPSVMSDRDSSPMHLIHHGTSYVEGPKPLHTN